MAESASEQVRLIASLGTGRCPLCVVLQKEEFNRLCHWVLIEGEEISRRKEMENRSFCNPHLWMLAEISSADGRARLAYALLANDLQKEKHFPAASDPCPVCEEIYVLEKGELDLLAASLRSEAFLENYSRSSGACSAHFLGILDRVEAPRLRGLLQEIDRAQRQRLLSALERFLKKQSLLARHSRTPEEERAGALTFERLAGRSRNLKVF